MTEEISVFLAFWAGFLSFLSPCILPLIPSYLGILGGMAPDGAGGKDAKARFRLAAVTLSFVLGFSAVFMAMSLFFSAGFFFLGEAAEYVNAAAGIIVIVLGFNVIFDFLSFLNYEKRLFRFSVKKGMGGAFLAGSAFAAGWTPCIGPILTGILLMAGQSGKTGIAVLYLGAYSAGLGLPFLAAAVFLDRFAARLACIRSRLPLIRRISGILLIVIGVLIFTGRYATLSSFFLPGTVSAR